MRHEIRIGVRVAFPQWMECRELKPVISMSEFIFPSKCVLMNSMFYIEGVHPCLTHICQTSPVTTFFFSYSCLIFLVLTFFQFSFLDNKPVFAVTNSPLPVCLAPSLIFLPDWNWLSLLFQLFPTSKTPEVFFFFFKHCHLLSWIIHYKFSLSQQCAQSLNRRPCCEYWHLVKYLK